MFGFNLPSAGSGLKPEPKRLGSICKIEPASDIDKMNLRNKTDKTLILNRKSKIVNLKSQNGYVLVIIIGILTILSLMAITFATLSRIETRATRNYTDSVKCEKIAKAGLEHAIYELWLDKFGTDTFAYNDNDSGNYGLDENFDASGTSWPGNSVFPNTGTDDYDNDGDGADDSRWIYFPLTDKAGTSTSAIRLPGNLLARYAVLITDDREARININVSGNKAGGPSHTSNEGWSTFEIDLSDLIERELGNGTTIANLIIDARHGADSNPGNAGDDDSAKIPDPLNDGIDNDGDSVLDEADEVTNESNEFNSIFPYDDDVPFGILSEAEIMGTTSYESRLEDIFNSNSVPEDSLNKWVTSYSADTIICPPYPLNGSTSTTMLNINALVNNGAYTDIQKVERIRDTLLAGGITGAAGSEGYVKRHQLAVNIKDFIDSDGTVTTYNDGADTYYGVDKTPYINEVEAEVNAGVAGGLGKYIELFNPYDSNIDITGWMITGGTAMLSTGLIGNILAQDYFVIADDQAAYLTFAYDGVNPPDQFHGNVNSLTANGEVLTLSDAFGNPVQVTHYGQADNTTDTRQLNDPRPTPLMDADGTINVNASIPWRWTTSLETAGGTNTATLDPAIGAVNDGWDTMPSTWPNSFLVANRRFSNKGYMGFIHKGSQWTSFRVGDTFAYPIVYPNLLDYITITDPSMDNLDNDGDDDIDTYDTDGDGDIDVNDTGDTSFQAGDLDGKEYRIPGLINVNTAPVEVLKSLPNGAGATIGNAIALAIEGSGSKPFMSIGDFVDKVAEITDTLATNKWDEEKISRSISNLITTRSNVFTVYVTAQITDEAISNVYAEKRILAIVDRSVDPIKVRYFRWLME